MPPAPRRCECPSDVKFRDISADGESTSTGSERKRSDSSPGGIKVIPENPRAACMATSMFEATAILRLQAHAFGAFGQYAGNIFYGFK